MSQPSSLSRQLEELNLLECSLLQGEEITFIPPSWDAELWEALLDSYPDPPPCDRPSPESPAKVQVKCADIPIWFEVHFPLGYGSSEEEQSSLESVISVRGDQISRADQERWQQIVKECVAEVHDSECVSGSMSYPSKYAYAV